MDYMDKRETMDKSKDRCDNANRASILRLNHSLEMLEFASQHNPPPLLRPPREKANSQSANRSTIDNWHHILLKGEYGPFEKYIALNFFKILLPKSGSFNKYKRSGVIVSVAIREADRIVVVAVEAVRNHPCWNWAGLWVSMCAEEGLSAICACAYPWAGGDWA